MTQKAHGHSGLPVGTLLDGKYEILGLLGIGGMGEVYKAEHTHLDALRCIKVMKPALAADEAFRARFMREARIATRVHHPNVAIVHDFSFTEQGVSYLVSEFIDGFTIRQWMREYGRFDVALACDIGIQVLAGLHEIHKLGLVHRDISAENIMVEYRDDHWVAKIIDLGIAKALEASGAEKTQVGFFVGNPRYSSPEQLGDLADGEDIDGRSDVYSLGVVMYEMVVGDGPFNSQTPQGYILKHLREAPRRLFDALPEAQWPDGFETVLMRALTKRRDDRYASARDFARALQPFASIGTRTVEVDIRDFLAHTQPAFVPPAPTLPNIIDEAAQTAEGDLQSLLGGAAHEAYEIALDENTPAAWRLFLERHGDSSDAAAAKEILEALEQAAFDRFVEERDASTLSRFLGEFPDSMHADAARELAIAWRAEDQLEEAWNTACAADSVPLYRAFASSYAAHPLAEEAKRRIEVKRYVQRVRAAEIARDLIALRTLERMRELPEVSKLAREAFHRIGKEAMELEAARAWDAAWQNGSSASFRAFLERFADSSLAPDAEGALAEALAFERVIEQEDPSMLEDFLHEYPEGRHSAEAHIRAARRSR